MRIRRCDTGHQHLLSAWTMKLLPDKERGKRRMENLLEARESIYDVVEMFFSGATIIWTEQINTKPQLPYITLKMGAIRKSVFTTVDENGKRVYQCSTILEINLYTTGNYINTATSDMAEFVAFLESENITDILAGKGLGIMLQESIRDLTDLHNDSHFRYRAMAEFSVSFVLAADGYYGISGMKEAPNSSGGGTPEMVAADMEYIEDVEIEEITQGGSDNEE